MASFGIRARILATVLGPAVIVAVLVAAMLIMGQMQRAEAEQHRRLAAVARQLAVLAEYSLFVGNTEALEKLVQAARREPDVLAAVFLDAKGKVLASTLPREQLPPAEQIFHGFDKLPPSTTVEHWHTLAIHATRLEGDDPYVVPSENAPVLGQLLLKVSSRSVHEEIRAYAWQAAALSAFILLVSIGLAIAFSRGLIRTLTEIGEVVTGIGRGDFSRRIAVRGDDELARLAQGINEMAAAVGQTQEQLAERILEATALLRHERDAAEHAARARSRFFAAASHDLRQPAQALGLFVARLLKEHPPPALEAKLRQLAQTIRNLQELLDTLLDYSRLDGQVVQVKLQPLRTTQAIGQVVENFADAAAEKGLTLRSRLRDAWVLTDPALLHRILINLLGNAIRHTRRGSILVACRKRGNTVRIEVWDTGPGIPPESREAIFDELVQLNNPERDPEKGLGLGLAIVRKSAALLGHPLTLCSRVGQGSRFALTVPLAAPPASSGSGEERSERMQAEILLISPATPARASLLDMLEKWQFSVRCASDPGSVKLDMKHLPACVILEPGDSSSIESSLSWLDRMTEAIGHPVPALIIGTGPAKGLGEQSEPAPRLLLQRPFRPARLRALLDRLLAHHETEE